MTLTAIFFSGFAIFIFFSGRIQRVVLRGTCSSWTPVLSGLPQGTILGPVLFILYVNDISSEISSTVKLYADNTKVYREISDIIITLISQANINNVFHN